METLREYLKKVNISQPVLAERLKNNPQPDAMVECGKRPLPEHWRQLFEVLQSLYREDDIINANGLPLPDEQVLLPAEACYF